MRKNVLYMKSITYFAAIVVIVESDEMAGKKKTRKNKMYFQFSILLEKQILGFIARLFF